MASQRTPWIVLAAVVAVLAVGGVALAWWGPYGGRDVAVPVPPASPTTSGERTSPIPRATTSPPAPSPTAPPSAPASALPTTTPARPVPPAPATLTITIATYDAKAGELVVAGYADLLTATATCTLTATSGTVERTASQGATADATTMSCGTLTLPRESLSPGIWTATLAMATPDGVVIATATTGIEVS